MTVDEKAQFITGDNGRCVGYLNGIDRLDISGICLEDGPVGIRRVAVPCCVDNCGYLGPRFDVLEELCDGERVLGRRFVCRHIMIIHPSVLDFVLTSTAR